MGKMKRPEDMTLGELKPFFAEFLKRKRKGRTPNPPILKPCKQCGRNLNARERRYACPKCGTYNREVR
jgi:hypothetical protein